MTDPHLFSVLDRATEGIEPGDAAQAATAALARARVIRTRRRGLVAGGVAAVAVLAVVVAAVPGVHRSSEPPATPAPTVTVPGVPDSAVQATWDPRDAGELPQRSSRLPATLEPPADAGPLPLDGAARLVLGDGGGPDEEGLYVLGDDGTWANEQAPSGSAYVSSLSDDGTMLANAGPGGLFVTDVRDGTWQQLDLPEGPESMWTGLDLTLTWRGDTQLLLRTGGGLLGVVDATGAERPRVDNFDTAQITGVAPAAGSPELVFGVGLEGQVIREVEDGRTMGTIVADELGRIRTPVASTVRVAGLVSGIPRADRPTDHAGVLVLGRDGYSTEAYLPIAGTKYTPGIGIVEIGANGVRPVAWLDDRTLLLVHASTTYERPWSLVAWDVESGELSLVSSGGPTTRLAGVARDLVRD